MSKSAAADQPPSSHDDAAPRSAWRFMPILLIGAGLFAAYALDLHHLLSLDALAESRDGLMAAVAAHPVLAPLLFVALYALVVALSLPVASVFTVSAGFLFGWLWGGVLAVIAATLGATILFLAARTAFGGALRSRVGSWGARLAEGFRKDAFGYLLVLRLAPFIPFVAVNVAPALFDVRLRTFVGATLLGIVPGALAYAWLGRGLDSVLLAARASGASVSPGDLVTPEITLAFAFLAGVALLAALLRRRMADVPSRPA